MIARHRVAALAFGAIMLLIGGAVGAYAGTQVAAAKPLRAACMAKDTTRDLSALRQGECPPGTRMRSLIRGFDTTRQVYGRGHVRCPVGYKVTGGGVRGLPVDTYQTTADVLGEPFAVGSDTYKIISSRPLRQGWRARALHTHGTTKGALWMYTTSVVRPRVIAICTR